MKKEVEVNPINNEVIGRYVRRDHTEYGDGEVWDDDLGGTVWGSTIVDYEIRWFDRVTDAQVLAYDGADPANKPPLGPSDEDVFLTKGLDINEEISVSRCKTPPTASEIASYAWRQAQRAEKVQETERGIELLGELDLFSYLELDASAFDFKQYAEHERTILKPAFERKGFSRIAFWMGEQDSFGPLSRGVRAWKDDKGYIFYYG